MELHLRMVIYFCYGHIVSCIDVAPRNHVAESSPLRFVEATTLRSRCCQGRALSLASYSIVTGGVDFFSGSVKGIGILGAPFGRRLLPSIQRAPRVLLLFWKEAEKTGTKVIFHCVF